MTSPIDSFYKDIKFIEDHKLEPHLLSREKLSNVPKEYWINCAPQLISEVFNRLPMQLRTDIDILMFLPCTKHDLQTDQNCDYDDYDGPRLLRYKCRSCIDETKNKKQYKV